MSVIDYFTFLVWFLYCFFFQQLEHCITNGFQSSKFLWKVCNWINKFFHKLDYIQLFVLEDIGERF